MCLDDPQLEKTQRQKSARVVCRGFLTVAGCPSTTPGCLVAHASGPIRELAVSALVACKEAASREAGTRLLAAVL